METKIVDILPFVTPRSYPTYEEWKHRPSEVELRKYNCSYPTYEEWKLTFLLALPSSPSTSSYPTYEEWKLKVSFNANSETDSSYPTYEEWKHTHA